MRRGDELLEAVGGERSDLCKRLAGDQFGRELAGDRGRDLDRLGFEAAFDGGEAADQPGEAVADLLERRRGAALGLRDALLLGGGEAVGKAPALGLAELDGVLVRRNRAIRLAGVRRKVGVEQEFLRGAHDQ